MFAHRKVLITGANRGIGLELVRQLRAQKASVIAVCRQTNSELKKLGVDVIDGVSVQKEGDVKAMVRALGDSKIDLVVNNAGSLEQPCLSEC
jgi:NAD(P)-dependent dehydrogenase (short-subunit alcohol dehydrogenase family)